MAEQKSEPTAQEPLPEHRVAVTFFASAPGVDAMDAADRVMYSIMRDLRKQARPDDTRFGIGYLEIPTFQGIGKREDLTPVRLVRVMETGAAMRNGYLWADSTALAWRMWDPQFPHTPEIDQNPEVDDEDGGEG